MIKEFFYDVANSYRRLSVKFRDFFDKIYQFIFDRRKDSFVTTTSQQTMLMHFFKQSKIVNCVDIVNENVEIVDEINDNYFTK